MNIEQIEKLYNEGKTLEAQGMIIDALSNDEFFKITSEYIRAITDLGIIMNKIEKAIIDGFSKFAKTLGDKKDKRREMYYRRYTRHRKG